MELYHFHKDGNYDKLWDINKVINVSPSFKSCTYKRVTNFTTSMINFDGPDVNYYQLVNQYIESGCFKQGKLNVDDLAQMFRFLLASHDIALRANEFKRESALENYRLSFYSNLPSRLHCIYLTDEKGIDKWKDKFGDVKLTLYRVEVHGQIFKTNEQLIPNEELSYNGVYEQAYKYWNPNFKNVPDTTNEYLTQGKIKVLEKIGKF